nr:uncharacterized protein LOC109163082 [Ipomoea trifida]
MRLVVHGDERTGGPGDSANRACVGCRPVDSRRIRTRVGSWCGRRRMMPVADFFVVVAGNRSKAPRYDPGVSQRCVSDDDFVSPPLAFLSRLQQDPIWNAPDGVLTDEEDDAFPRIKIRSTGSALVDALKDLSNTIEG